MTETKWILTDNPAVVFEDNAVGRMKKEVWDMTEEQLDAVLADMKCRRLPSSALREPIFRILPDIIR